MGTLVWSSGGRPAALIEPALPPDLVIPSHLKGVLEVARPTVDWIGIFQTLLDTAEPDRNGLTEQDLLASVTGGVRFDLKTPKK